MKIGTSISRAASVMLILMLGAASVNAQLLVKSYDESGNDQTASKPRILVQNTSGNTLTGFRLRYRVQVDPGKTPIIDPYYVAGGSATLVSEGGGLWDVLVSYPNSSVAPGAKFPDANGISVGIHNSDWSTWVKTDDPSYQAATSFQVNGKILVENSTGTVLYGQFPTQGLAGKPQLQVAAREEATNESNVSRIRVLARNVGTGAADSLKFTYYFASEGTKTPILDVYDAAGAKLKLRNVSGRNWAVDIDYSGTRIRPGARTSNLGSYFALHYSDWSAWNKNKDYSNPKTPVFSIVNSIIASADGGTINGIVPTSSILAVSNAIVAPLSAQSQVAAANNGSYLLKPDGTVWGWGTENQYSRFGTESRYGNKYGGTIQEFPVQISELKDIRRIVASDDYLFALDVSGVVWAVGSTGKAQLLAARAGQEQLALGTCSRPTQVGGLSGIV